MRVRKLPGALQPVAIPDDSTMEVVSLKVVLRSAFGNQLAAARSEPKADQVLGP